MKSSRTWGQLALWGLGMAVVACTESKPCDSQSMLRGSSCVAAMDAAADRAAMNPDASDAVTSPDGSDTSTMTPMTTSFGKTCADTPECMGDTDYCAKQPGQAAGYCTKTGCDQNPGLCPATWTCLNLGMFMPGLPHMCMKPP